MIIAKIRETRTIQGSSSPRAVSVSRNQHLTFWREQKTYEKNWQGKLKWLTFTNRFDNHKSIWALSDKYHSDAKWFGKHNGIIHFCLNLIAGKVFISRRWRTILKSWSVLFSFFTLPKCQVLVSTLTVLFVDHFLFVVCKKKLKEVSFVLLLLLLLLFFVWKASCVLECLWGYPLDNIFQEIKDSRESWPKCELYNGRFSTKTLEYLSTLVFIFYTNSSAVQVWWLLLSVICHPFSVRRPSKQN